MGVMQVAADEVIGVITVRDGGMTAARAMRVIPGVSSAIVAGCATSGIGGADRQRVFVRVPRVHVMQVPVVEIVGVTVVRDGDVPAAWPVRVRLGVPARITVYLKSDLVQAMALRFDTRDLQQVKAALRTRWGVPLAEATETISRNSKEDRKVFKMRWEKAADRAILTAQLEKQRATLEVSRGTFPEEIYRVR